MTIYAGLLRGVNVGGKKVSMAALARLLQDLGFEDVKTLLNSGNVVFSAGDKSVAKLESRLEDETAKQLNVKTDYMVRDGADLQQVVDENPFPDFARRDPGHLLVIFMKSAPPETAIAALEKSITGSEQVEARGRHLYVTYPDGIGRSRLTIEPVLKIRGTGRNWNTVLKLRDLVCR